MLELWSDLAPLVLVSAALPVQTVVTLALARASLRSAYAWVAGMMLVRLLQGVVFGVIFTPRDAASEPAPRYFLGALLLVLALALYVKAFRAATEADDEDAPPPRWITKASSMSPLAALGAGAGFMTISIKFLVFTLGAISAVSGAELDVETSILTFVLFVVLAHLAPLTILALASSSSQRASSALDRLRAWLRRNTRTINIVLGVVFGTWFLSKAASRLGIL